MSAPWVVALIGWCLAILGWFAGPLIGMRLERRKSRASERGKSDQAAINAAVEVIDALEQRLANLASGMAKPPREKPWLTVDERGHVTGYSTGEFDWTWEFILARRTQTAMRAFGWRRRNRITKLLTMIVGQIAIELSMTEPEDSLSIGTPMTLVSATYSGRRKYSSDQVNGALGLAVTDGTGTPESARHARKLLAKLRKRLMS